jgi:hypothetical protein
MYPHCTSGLAVDSRWWQWVWRRRRRWQWTGGGDSTGDEFGIGAISEAAHFISTLPIRGRVCSSARVEQREKGSPAPEGSSGSALGSAQPGLRDNNLRLLFTGTRQWRRFMVMWLGSPARSKSSSLFFKRPPPFFFFLGGHLNRCLRQPVLIMGKSVPWCSCLAP